VDQRLKIYAPIKCDPELNYNIIGIDFVHCNKLIYNVNTRQVKFTNSQMNTISAPRQITIAAMTSSIVTTKFNGEAHSEKNTLPLFIALDYQPSMECRQ
jgi:hypothetical protein